MIKFHIKTFGCQMNEYTSLYLSSLLSSKGLESDVKNADYIIVNTCAVREKVKHKIYSYIGKVNKIKKKEAKLIVIGCLGEINKDEIEKKFKPYIVGLYDKEEELFTLAKEIEGEVIKKGVPLISRYLPIIFGCNHFCSYCIVPFARGFEKSKPFDLILREAEEIYKEGAREIVLIGQNVNDYGKDLGLEDGFLKILKEVSKIPFERISFLTSHPKNFKLEWIDELKDIKNLLQLFHLPLQSGSNKVLKLMRRGYTIEEYLRIIEKIRDVFKDASITTDLLVGFPGEDEEDFLQTIDAVKKIEFDRAFMFSYSKRPKTYSEKLECEIPESEKLRRLNYLIKIQDEITLKKYKEFIGKEVEVLIENIKDGKGIGKEKGGRVVIVDGIKEEDFGKIIKTKIDKVNIRELFGKKI
ncbi:MAG: tRNA (N6-isopentenyl adenosine(37)-C2)-methylthiotransferase MiaB [Caldisericia bacterium]|nr:tRNA (N6-isopentenyl adenosine(37)-C2)-methylthiotransferase MiaB [Caldisericia bacterium]